MAKPKPSSSSPSLATSKTFSKPKENRKPFTHGSRRRPLISSPVPSSGLLAFLAGLTASSSTAYGHPIDTQVLPPEFLCPGLASDHPSETLLAPQPRLSRRVERRDDSDRPRPSQRHLAKRDSKRPFVPPKYVQGQDGRWRKIANWTLYGYCNCEPSSTEYSTLPVADNDVEATSASIFPSDSLPTIMEDQLPPGWKSSSESNHVLTYIILVLSLILAVLICIFMIGCIAWRKKRKERRDLEKTASSSSLRLGYESEEENEELRQAKKQKKLWAKASARWKANVRHSARRRRTQRNISSSNSLARASRTSLASTTMAASSSSVEAHMRSVVDVSDISLPSNSLDHENPPENETELPSSSASIIEPRPPAVPVSSRPPSYLRNSQPCPSSHHSDISERLTLPESVGEPINELSTSHKTRDVDLTELDHTSQDDPPPSPYEETPLDAAHVATDDKNILARMAAMASAPPVADQSNPSQSGNTSGPSVPILEFEHDVYEDHPDLSLSGPSSDSSHLPQPLPLPRRDELSLSLPAPSYSSNPHDSSTHHPLFPAPPSKGVLVAPSFYEYPASFEEDVLGAEPSAEPSAPPFDLEEIVPSAPPIEQGDDQVTSDRRMSLVPSAPPVLDTYMVPDDQTFSLVCASAPSMEDVDAINRQSSSSSSSSRTTGIPGSTDLPSYLP